MKNQTKDQRPKTEDRLKQICLLLTTYCLLLTAYYSPALAQSIAPDPTRLSLGSRILGMGKSFIGLADDLGAIYTNPAGLANLTHWQISSLSGKFLDEFSYLNLSGAYPTNFGVFGLGFAGSSISSGYATKVKEGSNPDDPIYEIDYSQPPISYFNNVSVLSWGNRFGNVFNIPSLEFLKDTNIGANFKLFSSGLSGDGITEGGASGNELDLGIQAKPTAWLSLGLTGQNILSAGMGGKLTYANGHFETYPAIIEAGSAITILDKENSLIPFNQKLIFLLDFDYYPTRAGFPLLYHTGLEWTPLYLISIRAGFDQDAVGDGTGTSLTTCSNLTAGVGLNLGGFRFDYAFHEFKGAPGTTNNFFSLSYGLFPPEKIEEIKVKLEVSEPQDQSLTFEGRVKVAGKIYDPKIRFLKVNGIPTKFTLKGDLETTLDLREGKNLIALTAYDQDVNLVASERIRIFRLRPFPDVPEDYWAREPISVIGMAGIVGGYPDGTFQPERNITRAEICSLLMKTRGTTDERTKGREIVAAKLALPFKDVSATHWAASYIAQAAELEIVKGYPGNLFKPNANISRAEGLAMIARFAGISEETYAQEFPDIVSSHWVARIIAGAHKAGILKYLEGKSFEPNRKLTRAEAVEILSRTQFVKDLLAKDLLNWDTY